MDVYGRYIKLLGRYYYGTCTIYEYWFSESKWSCSSSQTVSLPESNHFLNRNHETIQSKIRLDNILLVAKATTLRKKTMALQGGAPQVISWFIIPLTVDISSINQLWTLKYQSSFADIFEETSSVSSRVKRPLRRLHLTATVGYWVCWLCLKFCIVYSGFICIYRFISGFINPL